MVGAVVATLEYRPQRLDPVRVSLLASPLPNRVGHRRMGEPQQAERPIGSVLISDNGHPQFHIIGHKPSERRDHRVGYTVAQIL